MANILLYCSVRLTTLNTCLNVVLINRGILWNYSTIQWPTVIRTQQLLINRCEVSP